MVCNSCYEFIWNKFCDWYIEASKSNLYAEEETKNTTLNVLVYVLDKILKMLHPIMPFVTEKIYLELPNHDESIMISKFPEVNKELNFNSSAKVMHEVMEIVKNIRNVRKSMNVADNVKTNLYVVTTNREIKNNIEMLKKLANGKEVVCYKDESKVPANSTVCVKDLLKVFIPNLDMVNPEEEKIRLNNELKRVESEIERANRMLNNAGFVAKAPKALIEQEQAKIEKYNSLKQEILNSIEKYN